MPSEAASGAPWGDWVAFGLLSAMLIASAIIDIRTRKVPNALTVTAALLGILWATLSGALDASQAAHSAWDGLQLSTFGLVAGLIPFAAMFALGLVGGGDVKVMAAAGALSASWELVVATTFYGVLINALFAIFVMIRKGLVKQTFARLFGAVLMLSAKVKPDLDTNTEKIPFTFGFCVGGIVAGIEILLKVHTPWAAF
ncbi:MAG: hypothetical protein GC159_11275 [Phycisphaera sp.]|nr:hypothetical protein [Phycisphaera sp.]